MRVLFALLNSKDASIGWRGVLFSEPGYLIAALDGCSAALGGRALPYSVGDPVIQQHHERPSDLLVLSPRYSLVKMRVATLALFLVGVAEAHCTSNSSQPFHWMVSLTTDRPLPVPDLGLRQGHAKMEARTAG